MGGSDSSGVDYSPIAAGFKGLLPYTCKTRVACSDNDALIVEGCLARLKQKGLMSIRFLWHIIYTEYPSVRLQRCVGRMRELVRIEIQLAEGFIDGCLSMLDLTLDMDV